MRKLFLILFVLNCVAAAAQFNTDIPKEVNAFILKGHQVYDYIKGDLNGDGREDAILILEYKTVNESVNPFLILLRNSKNNLYQALRNDSILQDLSSVRNYMGIDIDTVHHNKFTIDFFGGRRFKWSRNISFEYKPQLKTWYLIEDKNESFDAIDEDHSYDESYTIKEAELGKITLQDFKYDDESYHETKGQVIVDKSYFYSNPNLLSKPRKGYVTKGDVVEVLFETVNFVSAYFTNKQGKSTMGFLLKKGLKLSPKQ